VNGLKSNVTESFPGALVQLPTMRPFTTIAGRKRPGDDLAAPAEGLLVPGGHQLEHPAHVLRRHEVERAAHPMR
jgi:hypothetical protein